MFKYCNFCFISVWLFLTLQLRYIISSTNLPLVRMNSVTNYHTGIKIRHSWVNRFKTNTSCFFFFCLQNYNLYQHLARSLMSQKGLSTDLPYESWADLRDVLMMVVGDVRQKDEGQGMLVSWTIPHLSHCSVSVVIVMN